MDHSLHFVPQSLLVAYCHRVNMITAWQHSDGFWFVLWHFLVSFHPTALPLESMFTGYLGQDLGSIVSLLLIQKLICDDTKLGTSNYAVGYASGEWT